MKSMIEKFKKHVAHSDYLEKEEVLSLIKEYPELRYEGVAYRMLVFSNPTKVCNISEDSSFSYELSGIKEYSFVQDLDYYKYIHLYKVNLIGLNLEKALKVFNLDQAPVIFREREVVLGDLQDQELIYNDKSEKFHDFLLSINKG